MSSEQYVSDIQDDYFITDVVIVNIYKQTSREGTEIYIIFLYGLLSLKEFPIPVKGYRSTYLHVVNIFNFGVSNFFYNLKLDQYLQVTSL